MDLGGGSSPDRGCLADWESVRVVGESWENALAADFQVLGWPCSEVHSVATSYGPSDPCVGYLASEPCLALAAGVEERHLESIMSKGNSRK